MNKKQDYKLNICRDKDDLSSIAVDKIYEIINNSLINNGNSKIVLSGGSTPFDVYLKLGKLDLDWNNVDIFLGDERWVDSSSKLSNNLMLRESILSTYPGNKANFFPIPTTDFLTPEDSARAFEDLLKEKFNNDFPCFDLMLLGLGEDGHTASLFPGTEALKEDDKWTTVGLSKEQYRITMTHPLLCSSKNIIFLVSGASKNVALKRLIDPSESFERTPAKLLNSPSEILILADQESAELV